MDPRASRRGQHNACSQHRETWCSRGKKAQLGCAMVSMDGVGNAGLWWVVIVGASASTGRARSVARLGQQDLAAVQGHDLAVGRAAATGAQRQGSLESVQLRRQRGGRRRVLVVSRPWLLLSDHCMRMHGSANKSRRRWAGHCSDAQFGIRLGSRWASAVLA